MLTISETTFNSLYAVLEREKKEKMKILDEYMAMLRCGIEFQDSDKKERHGISAGFPAAGGKRTAVRYRQRDR